jgi:glycosyltransferase involved in cell wall biosynthesis
VGRHEPQKGFDLLLEAFALIAANYPDWDLVIVGDGPNRSKLKARMQSLKLERRVILKEIVADVFQEFAASQLMAFPSRYEGFPNALAEAMAIGLPAIGFRDVSGVEDMILDGETGLLVDQKNGAPGLATAMTTLMGDDIKREKLGSAARQHVSRWAPDLVFPIWEDLLQSAVG